MTANANRTRDGVVRTFDTGATRDTDFDKLDYHGFLCHMTLQRYARYMHQHRFQSDEQLRPSDNWKKGIPQEQYMKSMFRHFMEVWSNHEADTINQDDLCALLFNVMGYLHEELKK